LRRNRDSDRYERSNGKKSSTVEGYHVYQEKGSAIERKHEIRFNQRNYQGSSTEYLPMHAGILSPCRRSIRFGWGCHQRHANQGCIVCIHGRSVRAGKEDFYSSQIILLLETHIIPLGRMDS
jgi:hypothetical protein